MPRSKLDFATLLHFERLRATCQLTSDVHSITESNRCLSTRCIVPEEGCCLSNVDPPQITLNNLDFAGDWTSPFQLESCLRRALFVMLYTDALTISSVNRWYPLVPIPSVFCSAYVVDSYRTPTNIGGRCEHSVLWLRNVLTFHSDARSFFYFSDRDLSNSSASGG